MKVENVDTTPVMIVGGSLVGLSAAVFLSWRGVPVVLVERHQGSSKHPRAIGYTTRTLELFRTVGVELPPSTHPDGPPRRARVESLTGTWFEEYPWSQPSAAPAIQYSPVRATAIAQDRLEPILRQRAVELGADLRLGTELIAFSQDDGGVTATLQSRDDGQEYRIRAQYVVAADGADSPVREALGIGRHGQGLLSVQRSILFRAPLDHYLERGVVQFEIAQPGLDAFLTTYTDGRWVLMLATDEDYSEDQQRQLIRQAVGDNDLPVDLITTGRWELAARIADEFSSGRIFLAGDAAHQLPPNRGGYGANTGIDDAHNLAWKLASVLAGTSTPELLATYDAERRPIAWLRHEQIFARADYKAHLTGPASDIPVIDDVAMELGQLYRSDALPVTAESLPPARLPDEWHGQPGTRAPHLNLESGNSTLDLFGRGWVLLTRDEAWRSAAAAATRHSGVEVEVVVLDRDDVSTAYGVSAKGASLIRPDGYIGWRCVDSPLDRDSALTTALRATAMAVLRTEARLQRLEDLEQIKAVTALYADAVNQGYGGKTIDLRTIARVFAPDAVYYGTAGETPVKGCGAIVTALPEATAPVTFAVHGYLNPVIRMVGDTAAATWMLSVASILHGEPGAAAVSTHFTYTKTADHWQIQSVRIDEGLRIPARSRH